MAEIVIAYGSSGSFKTAQAHFLAKYVYKRWGKITQLASCDGGGWKPLEPDIEAGLIEAWGISSVEKPRSVMRKLSQGFWPQIIETNGQRKLVLAPPTAETWKRVGCRVHEGLTSTANIIMRDALNNQLAVAGDSKGAISFQEDVNLIDAKGIESKGVEKYSFATQGNYNDAQRAVYDFACNYRSLPCPYVYITALEARGEEEDTRKTIIGPAVVGKAMTAQVGAWCGDLLHAEDFYVNVPDPTHKVEKGQLQRMMQVTKARYWFIRHPDPVTGMLFPAKPRVAPEQIPALLEIYPGGYFEPTTTNGLDAYLEVVERVQAAAAGDVREWMKQQDAARVAASTVGGTDAPKADPALVKATVSGQAK